MIIDILPSTACARLGSDNGQDSRKNPKRYIQTKHTNKEKTYKKRRTAESSPRTSIQAERKAQHFEVYENRGIPAEDQEPSSRVNGRNEIRTSRSGQAGEKQRRKPRDSVPRRKCPSTCENIGVRCLRARISHEQRHETLQTRGEEDDEILRKQQQQGKEVCEKHRPGTIGRNDTA
ncbi:hypothetical protein GALMADRAFT_1364473 [Galerina marginata CBS 339.88]|uniref:Uncharacterized protein n=1 Tax=Galerina marginata (strain CBS 339.88) TaxID=685588 RepID=A0A067S4C3_GALM3|nr:hypothetical protein GALMADRAFT_1364473 [Galerina marginata CBS 339.88]